MQLPLKFKRNLAPLMQVDDLKLQLKFFEYSQIECNQVTIVGLCANHLKNTKKHTQCVFYTHDFCS